MLALLLQAVLDAPVQDFSLADLLAGPDARVSLASFRGKKSVVLFFISYNCDASLDYEARKDRLLKDFAGKDVAFLAVRSSAEDTAAGMRAWAKGKGYAVPVLDDPGSKLAAYFNVGVTPTFCLIDREGRLRYRGALDDNLFADQVQRVYLREALDAVLAGREVAVKEHTAVGCHMPREK